MNHSCRHTPLRATFVPTGSGVLLAALLLVAAFAISLTGCAPATTSHPAAAAPDSSAASLVGAWKVRVQFTSGAYASVKDLAFMTVFNAGGTLVESSNYDETPPVPPGYGVWRATPEGGLEAHYEFYSTKPPADFQGLKSGGGWSPGGHGVLHETIRLAPDGRTYDSDVTLELFTTDGHPAAGGGVATAHGTRIAI